MPSSNEMLRNAGQQSHDTEFFRPMPPGYVKGHHKYVAVLGTVLSGIGKGIFASSLAKILKDRGLGVAPIKMEGYLNIDSGTLNPYRHGEVFVLDDGLETDMDLGTYERMLDQNLTRQNYTTSGQIFRDVLDKERAGKYLGRDVQMIPHVTGEVKYRLRELAMEQDSDVVFIEVGGTVGDYENGFYIEALRELAFEEGPENVCFVVLTYIIEPPALGEQKTKAAQLGMKKLMEAGIQPTLIACRAKNPLERGAHEKIALYSNVPADRVFSMHDRDSVYTIPTAMREDGVHQAVIDHLKLQDRVKETHEAEHAEAWEHFDTLVRAPKRNKCTIAVAGKYVSSPDAYASINKALEHCEAHLSTKVNIDWLDVEEVDPENPQARLRGIDGIIVPGGFGKRGTENKIACARYCRETGTPFLGICLGFQMAVVEFARNCAQLNGAGSHEFDESTDYPVIDILPEQKKIEGLGGNMRLGGKDVLIKEGSHAAKLYGLPEAGGTIRERFRHRYEVDPQFIETLEKAGLVFSGRHPEQPIMQVLELSDHPYFMAGQFHPELLSRPLRPHPLFMGLVAASVRHNDVNNASDTDIAQWLL